jgi:hypothetical protein
MTSAADFFTSTVKPTVSEFLTNVRDIRRGRLAAIVLYHMADYIALEGYTGQDRKIMNDRLDTLRKELIAKYPDFSLIRDIADASKHAQLSIPKKAARELSSSSQLTGSPGLFHAPFGQGVFAQAQIVFAILDNGTHKPLEPAIRSILTMWEEKLSKCRAQ